MPQKWTLKAKKSSWFRSEEEASKAEKQKFEALLTFLLFILLVFGLGAPAFAQSP